MWFPVAMQLAHCTIPRQIRNLKANRQRPFSAIECGSRVLGVGVLGEKTHERGRNKVRNRHRRKPEAHSSALGRLRRVAEIGSCVSAAAP